MPDAASGLLRARSDDVWPLLAEPCRLRDWWPGYQGVEPDRLGLAEGAQRRILRGSTRTATADLPFSPGGGGTIATGEVSGGRAGGWHDVEQRIDVYAAPARERSERTRVAAAIAGSDWRITLEGRSAPRQPVRRLHDICQTAAGL